MQMMRAPAAQGSRRERYETYNSNSFGKSAVWCQKFAFKGVMLFPSVILAPERTPTKKPARERKTHLVFPSLTSHPSEPGPASSTLL